PPTSATYTLSLHDALPICLLILNGQPVMSNRRPTASRRHGRLQTCATRLKPDPPIARSGFHFLLRSLCSLVAKSVCHQVSSSLTHSPFSSGNTARPFSRCPPLAMSFAINTAPSIST